MTGRFDALWASMEGKGSKASAGYLRRRLTASRDDGLFLGFDPTSRQRLFLVALPKGLDLPARHLPRWREIGVQLVTTRGPKASKLLVLSLRNPRFADVFTGFSEDLYRTVARLRPGPEVPRAIIERLEKWEQFLRAHGFVGLAKEEQEGLFGELWFLKNHVLPHLRGAEAVRRWKGPEGSAQDYLFDLNAIEVKSSLSRTPLMVRISSAEQLDDSGLDSLHLYVAQLSPASGGGMTLPDIVNDVRQALKKHRSGGDSFEQKLQDAGYLDNQSHEYTGAYEVSGESLFQVSGNFPRIVRPPKGILEVRYRLNTEYCRTHEVDMMATLDPIIGGRSGK